MHISNIDNNNKKPEKKIRKHKNKNHDQSGEESDLSIQYDKSDEENNDNNNKKKEKKEISTQYKNKNHDLSEKEYDLSVQYDKSDEESTDNNNKMKEKNEISSNYENKNHDQSEEESDLSKQNENSDDEKINDKQRNVELINPNQDNQQIKSQILIYDFSLKISIDGFYVVKLSEDPIFNQKIIDFKPIEERIKNINFKTIEKNFLEEEKDFGLFIMTKGAKSRLSRIQEAFNCKFPVLLEGPTGTSKTRSVQILSILMDKPLIRFNLSSETTTEDLLGRLVSDKESWGCFSFQEGPFIDAFAHGKWLLLDEINLAPQ